MNPSLLKICSRCHSTVRSDRKRRAATRRLVRPSARRTAISDSRLDKGPSGPICGPPTTRSTADSNAWRPGSGCTLGASACLGSRTTRTPQSAVTFGNRNLPRASNSMPEPATRSRRVLETAISPGTAWSLTAAATLRAMPPILPAICSHSPACNPARTSRPSRRAARTID